MGRFILSQLRHARGRTLTLVAGILVAAVSFTLLTATVTTSRLEAQETLDRNFRGAYDLLVRPPDSATEVERGQDLVAPNHLSGIYGGITREQYETVKDLPGIEVAAPIANVGYLFNTVDVPTSLEDLVLPEGPQVYRVSSRFLAHDGLSVYPGAREAYVYYTPDHELEFLYEEETWQVDGGTFTSRELHRVRQDGVNMWMCRFADFPDADEPTGLYDRDVITSLSCFGRDGGQEGEPPAVPAAGRQSWTNHLTAHPPMLLAAIDPEQEARLVGLDQAMIDGRYLEASDTHQLAEASGEDDPFFAGVPRDVPVITSARSYLDQSLEVTVERLQFNPDLTGDLFRMPPGSDLLDLMQTLRPAGLLREIPGEEVDRQVLDPDAVHSYLLDPYVVQGDEETAARVAQEQAWPVEAYARTSPAAYDLLGPGRLAAVPTARGDDVKDADVRSWADPRPDRVRQFLGTPPPGNEDVRYRDLTVLHMDRTAWQAEPEEQERPGELPMATTREIGRFDPELLTEFSEYSRLPLETYYPPEVRAGDDGAREALGDRPLGPTHNLGGYVGQPAAMLTTLDAVAPLTDAEWYQGAEGAAGTEAAPISVIRVRVEGVTGVDERSQERIRRAAEAIRLETGLQVDIVAGASPTPMQVELAAGDFGQPPLTVEEGWIAKRAAVVISQAVDRKSAALFPLVLVACGLFLANASFAAVRARRRELGVLRCIGWSAGRVFAAVLGELALAGLAAGLLGTLLALVIARLAGLNLPTAQALLVVPVAVLLALAAGLPPAWRASLGQPLDAVRPPVLGARRRRGVRGLVTMALRNLGRVPGRTLLAAVSLAIGIAALTVLLAINLAFQGVVAGTLLGDLLATQVRAVDYVAVALASLLGAASVADVLVLNLRERAAELLTLSTTGWRDGHVTRLAWLEGAGMGLLGSLLGATAGLGVATQLGAGASLTGLAAAAGLAALTGLLVVLLVLLVALRLLWRSPAPTVLAQE